METFNNNKQNKTYTPTFSCYVIVICDFEGAEDARKTFVFYFDLRQIISFVDFWKFSVNLILFGSVFVFNINSACLFLSLSLSLIHRHPPHLPLHSIMATNYFLKYIFQHQMVFLFSASFWFRMLLSMATLAARCVRTCNWNHVAIFRCKCHYFFVCAPPDDTVFFAEIKMYLLSFRFDNKIVRKNMVS